MEHRGSLLKRRLKQGRDVILEIDVQGALQVKEAYPNAVFIFLLPPTMEDLRKRIEQPWNGEPKSIESSFAGSNKRV